MMWKFTRDHLSAARMMRENPQQAVGAYLLDGTRLECAPEKGIYIRMSVGADGHVSTEKLGAR